MKISHPQIFFHHNWAFPGCLRLPVTPWDVSIVEEGWDETSIEILELVGRKTQPRHKISMGRTVYLPIHEWLIFDGSVYVGKDTIIHGSLGL